MPRFVHSLPVALICQLDRDEGSGYRGEALGERLLDDGFRRVSTSDTQSGQFN